MYIVYIWFAHLHRKGSNIMYKLERDSMYLILGIIRHVWNLNVADRVTQLFDRLLTAWTPYKKLLLYIHVCCFIYWFADAPVVNHT